MTVTSRQGLRRPPISMTLLNSGCRDYHNVWPANRHRVYPGLSCQDALGDSRPVSDKANDRQPLIQATNQAGSVERGAWSKNELQASNPPNSPPQAPC
jgi:hypothetical protein